MSNQKSGEANKTAPAGSQRARRGRRRRKPGRLWRLGTLLSGLLTFSLLAIVGLVGAVYVLKIQFDNAGPLPDEKTVIIASGLGLSGIASQLERSGVIKSSETFMAGVLIKRASGDLKAGEYKFAANISMNGVLDKLVNGRSVRHKVTIAEGLTTQQVLARLKENEILVGKIDKVPQEGSLLPDTYLFQRGLDRNQIIERMTNAQAALIEELWPKRDKDKIEVNTPQEALILASIVEKETGVASERARIAAVFHNRLRKSMRLQSDPTIIYGLVGGKGVLGRPIRRSEIDRKTPYNTYQIDGLPPTPIANPGRAAIEAVLKPATTDELYFVADGTGGHVFAKSLQEHQKNVAAWRKVEAERRAEEAEAAEDGDEDVEKPGVEIKPVGNGKPAASGADKPKDANAAE